MEENSKLEAVIKNLIADNEVKLIELDEIKLDKKIEFGEQTKVYKGTWNEKNAALKVLTDIDEECFRNKVTILSKVKCICIPKFYGLVHTDDVVGFLFQYINGKTLDEYEFSDLTDTQKLESSSHFPLR